MITPFREAPFAVPPEEWLQPALAAYGGLYREALNSTSTVYRFLCFFRIIESLYHRRDRLREEARQKGETLRRPRELIPRQATEFVPWLNAIFPVRHEWDDLDLASIFQPEAIGRKIRRLYQDDLRLVRNSIAHALLEDSRELVASPDDAIPHAQVDKFLHLDYEPPWRTWLLQIMTRLRTSTCATLRNRMEQWGESLLSEIGLALTTKVSTLGAVLRLFDGLMARLHEVLKDKTDTEIAELVRRSAAMGLPRPERDRLPYDILVAVDAFFYGFRSAYEILTQKFLPEFFRHVLGCAFRSIWITDFGIGITCFGMGITGRFGMWITDFGIGITRFGMGISDVGIGITPVGREVIGSSA